MNECKEVFFVLETPGGKIQNATRRPKCQNGRLNENDESAGSPLLSSRLLNSERLQDSMALAANSTLEDYSIFRFETSQDPTQAHTAMTQDFEDMQLSIISVSQGEDGHTKSDCSRSSNLVLTNDGFNNNEEVKVCESAKGDH